MLLRYCVTDVVPACVCVLRAATQTLFPGGGGGGGGGRYHGRRASSLVGVC